MINVTKTMLPNIQEYVSYLKNVWERNWITNDGELVKKLEGKLSKFLGVDNFALVTNGTLGLQLAIKSLKLKGEVITTPFTFAATTNVIVWEGLTPVFADINPKTFNIDPNEVEKLITKRTSAILAVHVFGNPCDVEALEKIAQRHQIKLIYDSAHAFGVKYKGKSILDFGDISVLSFHATKTFHTVEGGAVVTKERNLIKSVRLMRNFGIESEEKVLLCGINAKMNEFQAAMGLSNMPYIPSIIKKRKKIYMQYKHLLGDMGDISFQEIPTIDYNFSYMPILLKNKTTRDRVYLHLKKNGINARKYFYPLTSNFPHVKVSAKKSRLLNSKKISNTILCLPIYHDMDHRDVERITKLIKRILHT